MIKLATKTISAVKQDRRNTGRTVTVTWSSWAQPVIEYRDTELEGEVTLHINVEALLSMLGPKALTAKTKRAVEASGAVLVTARVTSSKPGEWKELSK